MKIILPGLKVVLNGEDLKKLHMSIIAKKLKSRPRPNQCEIIYFQS